MNILEFSNEFDVLLNSYSTIQETGLVSNRGSIELDEYEKSVLLTLAQEELIVDLYEGNNSKNESFEETEKLRSYLEELIKTVSITAQVPGILTSLSPKSVFYKLPLDVWFITYESGRINDRNAGSLDGTDLIIKPITQDSYFTILRNPFKAPNKRRGVRLDLSDNLKEIISEYSLSRYLVRYLSEPSPIVLVSLGDLAINGVNIETECKLNPVMHRYILKRAVQLALQRYAPQVTKQ